MAYKHKKDYSPIIHYVLYNNIQAIEKLLKKGTDPNYSGVINKRNFNLANHTVLLAAIIEKRIDIIKLLLSYNVDVNKADASGYTPLIMAAVQDNIEILELLFKHGADPLNETNYKADFIDKGFKPNMNYWLCQDDNQKFLLDKWPTLILSLVNNKIILSDYAVKKYYHIVSAKELNLI